MINLILASQSPRRHKLIQLLNLPVTCIAANVDESQITLSNPKTNVIETARLKCHAIAASPNVSRNTWILGVDTTVALEDQMLNKPADEMSARMMLQSLRARDHFVHSGFVLLNPTTGQEIEDVHSARVLMRGYSDAEIDAYIATGDPMDKAGGYAIQHAHFKPVVELSGCFMGVVGLSICHLIQVMRINGIKLELDITAIYNAHAPYFRCPLFPKIQSP
jgi:septum formation protein